MSGPRSTGAVVAPAGGVLVLPWLVTSVTTALTWRITADRDGPWVTGAWRLRRDPWDVTTSVRHHEDGLRAGRAKDSSVDVSPTG